MRRAARGASVRRGAWVPVAWLVLGSCLGSLSPRGAHEADGVSAARREERTQPMQPASAGENTLESGWREAAAVEDWGAVAQRIDGLPARARTQPKARYVRAVAARHLGENALVLEQLGGLEQLLPELEEDIAALLAAAQLEVGPFAAAATHYSNQRSARAWFKAARAWQRAGEWARAQQEVERVLGERRLGRALKVQARTLHAELAERMGLPEVARREYRWLAVDAARPGADAAYERVARTPLTQRERLARAQKLARKGDVEGVRRELELLKRAPGKPAASASVQRCLARAYHRSRRSYRKAAELYERLMRRGRGAQASDGLNAAEAWSREGQTRRAAQLYREVMARYPNGAAAEEAHYWLARLSYGQGAWKEAERAYARYVGRYARGARSRRSRWLEGSRYERALSQLAAGRAQEALRGFQELQRSGSRTYRASMLRHLEAVALSAVPSAQPEQVALGFQEVIRDYPLSFAALASAARLMRLGRPIPAWAPPPGRPAAETQAPLELPPKARLFAELGLLAAAEGALHSEHHELAGPAGGPRALCARYAVLDRGFRSLALARQSVAESILKRPPTASSSWAWHCSYPRPFAALVAELEARHDIPSGLVHAVMRQESAFRPDARSPVGAVGLMQLMPRTAERAAAELDLPHDPERLDHVHYNLKLGAFYLGKLLDSFERHEVLALASYNAGPHAVSRWLGTAKGLPLDLWAAWIPYRETREYVQGVMSNWATYRYLNAGRSEAVELRLELPEAVKLAASAY